MDPRIERRRERAWRSYVVAPEVTGLEPGHLPDDPAIVRQARDLAAWYRAQPVRIFDDELIVGTPPHLQYGDAVPMPAAFGRQSFTPWPHLGLDEGSAACFRGGLLAFAGNHTTIDYRLVLDEGFTGIVARIDERLARASTLNADQAAFLRALRIVAEGYIALCGRHAVLADRQAAEADEGARAEELRRVAERCRRVVALPPRTFPEACQALWFSFAFVPDAPGRVDYLLRPYYDRDTQAGTLTADHARALVSELLLRYFEWVGAAQAVSAINHLTLGGTTPDGDDASSELTDLVLDAAAELRIHRPQIGLRWHAAMPVERLRHAVRTWRAGTGSPDLCSDEAIVPALIRIGVAPEDARDFSLSGCQEVIVTGKAQMGSVEGFVNLPMALRMALGLEPDLYPPPPDPGAFEDLLAEFDAALEHTAAAAHAASVLRDRAAAADPGLQASLVVHDCIENARGYTQGGARYNFCNWNVVGLANTADALSAVRRLVYEEKRLGLAELRDVLLSSWHGSEDLLAAIGRTAPAFGNDDESVDALAAGIIVRLDAALKRHAPYRGGCYILGTTAGGENMHVEFGRVTGATPDGRRAGDTLCDSVGAAQGRDRSGITALLNSVARLPHHLLPTATTLNVKLGPALLDTERGVELVADLVRSHFASGGQHCQANLCTREMLLEARAHPEQHRDLMVRVAGYSAQFISLWEDLQDEIIARTAHAV